MNYIGDIDNIDNIEKFLLSKKNHHSIIFNGEKGIGKSIAARNIVSNILNSQGSNEIYNLKWVSPDSKSDKITIDQIRDLYGFLNQTDFDGKRRFVVIDAADDLNVNSANILLKPLEEPKNNCFFILINHKSSKILPTIKSRCINFRFSPPSKIQAEEILLPFVNYDKDLAKKYLIIANYNVGQAVNLSNLNLYDFYNYLLKFLSSKNFDFSSINAEISKLEFSDNWQSFFFLLKRVCYFLMNKYSIAVDSENAMSQSLSKLNYEELGKLVDHINDIEYKIANLYLSKKDCFQVVCLKLHELCQKTII